MSMTEELHKQLSERGVVWSQTVAEGVLGGTYTTSWRTDDGTQCDYAERIDKYPPYSFKRLTLYDITPEQAIAVTLGAGTCHDVGDERIFHCSECGCGITDIYLRDEGVYRDDNGNYIGDKWPRYCPHCGAKVVYE